MKTPKSLKSLITGSLVGLSLSGVATAASAADLTVTFQNIEEASGSIMIAVYNDPVKFLAPGGSIAYGRIDATTGPASFTFKDLAPGEYAISSFHDVDGNGKLKTNFMGIPREPIGMSRDAKGVMGPPSYDDAVFTLPAEGTKLEITLD